jgi:hypothetical protein
MASMRLLKHATSHQKTMKMEARCDPEEASAPMTRACGTYPKFLSSGGTDILILKKTSTAAARVHTVDLEFSM